MERVLEPAHLLERCLHLRPVEIAGRGVDAAVDAEPGLRRVSEAKLVERGDSVRGHVSSSRSRGFVSLASMFSTHHAWCSRHSHPAFVPLYSTLTIGVAVQFS